MDSKTGKCIILWSDIQSGFKDVSSIRKGETLVPFMKDEEFKQILPLRIPYHPEVVLDVIVEGDDQPDSTRQDIDTTRVTPMNKESRANKDDFNIHQTTESNNPTGIAETPTEAEIKVNRRSVVRYSDGMPEEAQSALHSFDQLYHSYFQAVVTGQEIHATNIIQSMGQHFDQLQIEMAKNKALQEQMTPPAIHLAKHGGYDLDKPTEFFERYGSYILTLMYMVKLGITAAGMVVPPLASLKILDGLDNAQDHVKYLRRNIAPLVDDTIKALQDFKSFDRTSIELATGNTEFADLEGLEGADLRQLEFYLKIKDQGRVLGNLYRVVTPKGHVKWVCLDHYRANYREPVIQQLRDVVEVNHGRFLEETGRIEIKIASNILAKQFYDSMVQARGIQELDIILEWDATMDDLRALAKAVTKASIIRLTMDGTSFKSPALDVINRSRRFDPILQLAFNTRVQSLQLKGFEDFFSRISKSSLVSASQLREFLMESRVHMDDKALMSFNSFLGHSATLSKLELKLHPQYLVSKTATDILSKLQKLESLTIDCGKRSITASVSQSKVLEVDMTIERLQDLSLDDFDFIKKDHLTRLTVKYTTPYENRLATVLSHYPRLHHLRIGCKSVHILAIINRAISTREKILQSIGSSCLRTVELMEEELIPFDLLADCDDKTHVHSILSFAEDSNSFDMRTWIRLLNFTNVTHADSLKDFVQHYGWSIVFFSEGYTSNNTFAAILDEIPFSMTMMTRPSQLQSLRFDAEKFTSSGFDRLDGIIKRSKNFQELGLHLPLNEEHFEMAERLLSRYRTMVNVLRLYDDHERWLPLIASLFPIRTSFPKLISFDLWTWRHSFLPSSAFPWVVTMVSAPPPPPSSSSSSSSSLPQILALPLSLSQDLSLSVDDNNNNTDTQNESETGELWAALKKISLHEIRLEPEEWSTLIEAIDFLELEHLNLESSNISQEEFKLLIDRIPNNIPKVSLKTLNIRSTGCVEKTDSYSLLVELRRK
ncbi:hypothetical protein BGZ65_003007, partial [Modicella reniformis]